MTIVWSLPVAFVLRSRLGLQSTDTMETLSARNDEVAAKSAEAGATLAKMQAEATLCQNLLTGFLVLLVLDRTGTVAIPVLDGHGFAFRVFVALGLAAASIFREGAYLFRQKRLHGLYGPAA